MGGGMKIDVVLGDAGAGKGCINSGLQYRYMQNHIYITTSKSAGVFRVKKNEQVTFC